MQVFIQIWVINGKHSAALFHALLVRVDSLGDIFEIFGGQCLVLDPHGQHQCVIRHNFAIVQNHVFIGSIDVSDSRVNHLDASLEHQLFELLEGIACRVCFQVALFVWDVMVRDTAW